MNNTYVTIAVLYMAGVVNQREAELLQSCLKGQEIPTSFMGVIETFENILGRSLDGSSRL